MTRAAGLALVVAVLVAVQQITRRDAGDAADILLALGFTLVMAMAAGDLLRRFRLPRLTGYLLFGLLAGPYLGNLITAPMARQLQLVNGIATTLIAFIAGLTLNFERLERRDGKVPQLLAVMLAVSMTALFVIAYAGWSWLPIAPGASGLARAAMVALFVVIVVSFSPTMTAAVISETGARGRVSELVLALVVLADLAALVLFSLAMQFARYVLEVRTGEVGVLARLAWEIGGAVSFGALAGAVFALYLRYVTREVTLVLLGLCVVLSRVGALGGVEPLLAAMTAGMVVQNVSMPQGDALKTAIQRGALPVLVVFFVSIGVSLQVQALAAVGLVALVLVAARLALIRAGIGVGLRASGMEPELAPFIWRGLISQAGITVGLASVIALEFPGWGEQLQLLLVAVVAVDELIGPALFRAALTRAGELEASSTRPLVVVSNREPYLHSYDDNGGIRVSHATGGVAVALDALMRDRGGTWIACGDGTADRAVVDERDRISVPPDQPSYLLRRIWIEKAQYDAYYGGFANEGLWPLCHLVDVRPRFRTEDWQAYQAANLQFARAVHEEAGPDDTPVFIQDYHLALAAGALRSLRPGCRTALFWHIPWPHPDRLSICPWHRELLEGLLANDLLAFQVERDRRNFMLAAEEFLDVEVEADGERVRHNRRVTSVVAVPIGVDYDRIQRIGGEPSLGALQQTLAARFELTDALVGLGVDRLDYTKGIPERLDALDRLFQRRPELRGRLTFVQVGVPSRSDLESYGTIATQIDRRVEEINARHAVPGRPLPVCYFKGALNLQELVALYRLARFCIVSSLHDGMNLVAKEFVASREDEDGVLVLSALAGAAQELGDALIINPYDIDAFADALSRAVDMPEAERRVRMRGMRRVVAGRDVFNWASDILEGLESLWTRPLQYASRAPGDAPV